jgi:CheY-like chemotaxis protein
MPTKSVLLIEQEVEIRELLRLCLQDLGGWRIIEANSLHEGLEWLTLIRPDAILLDILMLEIEDLQIIHLLQEQVGRSLPIVLITDKARWFTAAQLHSFGVVGAIAKPFNPLSLPSEVAYLLGWSIP